MLVLVDPDRTMNAAGGEGVGVFTEYQTGGHWRVWWTCDTNKTNQACHFDIAVSVASGSITNLQPDRFVQTSPQKLEAVTTTTTARDGVEFDTAAGATITLAAQIDGQWDGSFLFFVQDGKINGGYGTVTDPLMLQPLTP
jgi:hypothetical protein